MRSVFQGFFYKHYQKLTYRQQLSVSRVVCPKDVEREGILLKLQIFYSQRWKWGSIIFAGAILCCFFARYLLNQFYAWWFYYSRCIELIGRNRDKSHNELCTVEPPSWEALAAFGVQLWWLLSIVAVEAVGSLLIVWYLLNLNDAGFLVS